MQSTLTEKPSDDPHDFVVVAPDAVKVAPSDDEISSLLHQAARLRSDQQTGAGSEVPVGAMIPPVDTTFRPTAVGDLSGGGWSMARRALRGLTALLLAVCIGVGAVAWKAYGDTAKKQIAKWTTQIVLAASLTSEKPAQSAQPAVAADGTEAGATNTAAQPPAAAAQSSSQDTVPAPSPETTQLQSMARDLASVGQEVEQLKASIAQLKASQQQMLRDLAKATETKAAEIKASEQSARPRTPASSPRAAVARPRKPTPSYPPTQAAGGPALQPAAAPYPAPAPYPPAPYYGPRQQSDYAPRQYEPPPRPAGETLGDPELSSVPRPPMPLR